MWTYWKISLTFPGQPKKDLFLIDFHWLDKPCKKFYRQDEIFLTYAKKFYGEIGKNKVIVKETPPKDNIEKFWKGMWGKENACNMTPNWIGNTEKENEQEWENITAPELRAALIKSQKWESPGTDKVPRLLLNALS